MRKYFVFLLPLFFLFFFLFNLSPVAAQYGLDVTGGRAGYRSGDTPSSILSTVVNSLLTVVYIIFFLLMLYAGLRWMTAQGNDEHVTKAKHVLEAAIIGLAIISAAYAITNFVLNKVGATEEGVVVVPNTNNSENETGMTAESTVDRSTAFSSGRAFCCDDGAYACFVRPLADPTDPDAQEAQHDQCFIQYHCVRGACVQE